MGSVHYPLWLERVEPILNRISFSDSHVAILHREVMFLEACHGASHDCRAQHVKNDKSKRRDTKLF